MNNNHITLHRILDTEDTFLPLLEELYVSAFPSEERRELIELREKIVSDERFHPHALLQDGVFFGLLNWWDFGDFIYGEHFATLPELRGQGLGTIALEDLKLRHSGRPVIIEVEHPTDELTTRRIQFYERRGLIGHDTPYVQPPYRWTDTPTPMKLMSYGTLAQVDLTPFIQTIYREVYGVTE